LSFRNSILDLEFVRALGPQHHKMLFQLLGKSKSQLRQDLFVLSETAYKKEGYFVEFGATDGLALSNTYLLETEFSWKGILAEPAIVWKKDLRKNRPDASIETLCVWENSDSWLSFNEANSPELSSIDTFNENKNRNTRRTGKKYEVQTISLNDLLRKHNSPKYIDYMSIDTEGSEYKILSTLNFKEFSFGIITVEHNYAPQRELIFNLLTMNGYKRRYQNISYFDDWYTKI
jgi:FkbM family methyltransferase